MTSAVLSYSSPRENAASKSVSRTAYFDNLRSLLIVLVVLGHCFMPYTSFINWWYVPSSESLAFFDIAVVILSIIVMPPLFFVSGYFLVPTIERKGMREFWLVRIRKLILPWLVCIICISPLLTYTRYWHITESPMQYADYLKYYLAGFGNVYTGILQDFDSIDKHHIWWHHLWFIPTLLVITFIATLFIATNKRRYNNLAPRVDAEFPIQSVLWFVSLSMVAVLLTTLLIPDYLFQNVVLLNLFKAHPTRFILYVFLFFAGIYWYRYNTFSSHRLLKLSWVHYVVALFGCVAYLGTLQAIQPPQKVPFVLTILQGVAVVLVIWAALFCFLAFAKKHLNKTGRISKELSAQSFNIYLTHYPLIVLAHFGLSFIALPVIFKALIAFTLVFIVSFSSSRFVINPFPRLAVACLVALQILFLTFL